MNSGNVGSAYRNATNASKKHKNEEWDCNTTRKQDEKPTPAINNNPNPNSNPNHNTKTNSNPDPNPPLVDCI